MSAHQKDGRLWNNNYESTVFSPEQHENIIDTFMPSIILALSIKMSFVIFLGLLSAVPCLNLAGRYSEHVATYIGLEYHNSSTNSHKHWSISVNGSSTVRRWGRLPFGEDPGWTRTLETSHSSPQDALKWAKMMVRRKIRAGYVVKKGGSL